MKFQAAVLHRPREPIAIETVEAEDLIPSDVLVRIRATSLCHTDLEVIEGHLVYPMPIVLGHEAAGTVERLGSAVSHLKPGDPVVISWNPHCGHCFYCDHGQPILCETYLGLGPKAVQFDGRTKLSLGGTPVHHMMYVSSFAEYCIVPAQSAVVVPKEIPFDRACLIGCGVMTGVGAATRIARIPYGAVAAVIGCGAVGLSAVQGARLAGAGAILAIDLDDKKLGLAKTLGATHVVNAEREDPVAVAKSLTRNRGADCVLEAAGDPRAFRLSAELVRPGGQIGLANWTPDGFIGQLFSLIGRTVPPPPGVPPPPLWGTLPYCEALFGDIVTSVQAQHRDFVFRYASPEHFVDVFRKYYGPIHRLYDALPADRAAAFTHDLLQLIGRFNRSNDGTAVIPSRYLELVVTRC